MDGVLDRIFAEIPEAFMPEKAADERSTLQYEIAVPGGVRGYFIRVHDGTCTTARGSVDAPRAVAQVEFTDFLRIVTGRLAGVQAYLSGKLKISGDVLFITRFEGWFERP